MEISGKSVIVTGGARNIGFSIAEALLTRGARVTIGASSPESIDQAVKRLGHAERLASVASDISSVEGSRVVVDTALEAFGDIDALVANAGVYASAPIEDVTEELFDRVIGTNLKGTYFCVQAALPALRHAEGAVVMMSSHHGRVGVAARASVYGAAKAAIANLTQQLAIELAPAVRVNCVAPGFIETDRLRARPEFAATLAAMTPAGRVGTTQEIADAVLFAIRNDFLNGAIIGVDGGRHAGSMQPVA